MAELIVYSTASDGSVSSINDDDYETAHDGANGATIYKTQDQLYIYNSYYAASPNYRMWRSFLYFDTSALGVGAIISAATLSLYGSGSDETDEGHSDLGIVEGVQGDPLAIGDYGDHLSKRTLGADTYFAYPIAEDAYTDKALNATGIGWISKIGITKFCIRLKGDRDWTTPNGEPTGYNYQRVWSNEKGNGYQPKLVITYTPLVAVRRSFGYIIG